MSMDEIKHKKIVIKYIDGMGTHKDKFNKFGDIYSDIIYETQAVSIKEAVEKAVRNGVGLQKANLYGANLQGADLRGANSGHTYLYSANLDEADLRKANLRGADLAHSYLGADLRGADFLDADLYGAYLYGAKFSISREELFRIVFNVANAFMDKSTQFNIPLL